MSYATGDSLKVRIRIAFGASIAADPATWAWTDVTSWWHTPDEVQIAWGRSSGAEQAEPGTLSLTLKNTDGRFTAYDPRSPYWPNVRKWTPISYEVDLGDGVGWRNRFSGFLRRLPLTWPGASPLMALARIEAVGVLGRMGRGKPPSQSPMRRTIPAPPATGLLAYWPLEDEADSTQAASAIPAVPAMTAQGGVVYAAGQVDDSRGGTYRYGTLPVVSLIAGGALYGSVPPGSSSPVAWSVQALYMAADAADDDVVQMRWETPTGSFVRWELIQDLGTVDGTYLVAYDQAGARTTVWSSPATFTGPAELVVAARQNGANIAVTFRFGTAAFTASVAGTLGYIATIGLNPDRWVFSASERFVIGHLRVWDHADAVPRSHLEIHGNYGEAAHARLARLAAEDGLAVTMPAVPAESAVALASQGEGVPLGLYEECEAADQGLIYEAGFGLGYLPRSARYNAAVALTIDASAGQLGMPFEPVDDDQGLRNRWTVERVGGSSAAAADQQSIDLQGEIEAKATVNLATDGPLPDHASWRLRLSTVQEPRYPAVSINLAAHPELAAAWTSCKPGSRVQVINPPAQNVPGVVDQLVVGATETYRGRRSWKATLNVQPASPWDVAVADGTQRVAADGSTLAAGITSGGTSLILASTAANGPWTTDGADMPLDVRVGGERVTVSSIGPAVADVFSRTVSNGWGTANSGQAWTTTGGSASDYSVSGGTAQHVHNGVGVLHHSFIAPGGSRDFTMVTDVTIPVTPTGSAITVWAVVREVDANNYYTAQLAIAPGGATTLTWLKRVGGSLASLAPGVTVGTHTAGATWRISAAISGTALSAKAWIPSAGDPGWQTTAADSAITTGTQAGILSRLETGNTNTLPLAISVDNFTVVSPQTATVSARGVNGVARAWPAGTEVDVWAPAVVSL